MDRGPVSEDVGLIGKEGIGGGMDVDVDGALEILIL